MAIVGGSWFTYQSFASNVLYRWFPKDVQDCTRSELGCSLVPDAQKGGNDVIVMASPNGNHGRFTINQRAYLKANHKYDVCVNIKGVGSVYPAIFPQGGGEGLYYFHRNIAATNRNSYTEECRSITVNRTSNYRMQIIFRPTQRQADGTMTGLVTVSQIFIKPSAIPISTNK